MIKTLIVVLVACAGCLVGLTATKANAQSSAPATDVAAFYSQGVHAYFAGQWAQGEADLSTAIAGAQ